MQQVVILWRIMYLSLQRSVEIYDCVVWSREVQTQ